MDPIAHTLVGAALASTRLRRTTALAAPALIAGANLPDVDGFCYFAGQDVALMHRRGWTHGVLALVVLPALLAGLLALIHRWRGRGSGPPLRPGMLLGLCYLALLTHPTLDWMNTYGMRWLMPFDGRWFYGDTLFIIDPWIWLCLGAAVFLGRRRGRAGLVGWAILALLTSVIVLLAPPTPWPAQLLWLVGVVTVVGLAVRDRFADGEGQRHSWARAALGLVTLYVLGMLLVGHLARGRVRDELVRLGMGPVEDLMVAPVPANPLQWQVVAVLPDEYRYGAFSFRSGLSLVSRSLSRIEPDRVVAAALASPDVRGLVDWIRFPFYEVEEDDDGYVVWILDARYTQERTEGFGGAAVRLDRSLRPRADSD